MQDMKVYADYIFLLNFIIDYLLLLATGKICALHLGRGRMLLGAAWGGVYSVLALVWPSFFAMGTVKLFAGALAAAIAFGGQGKLLRSIVVFFAVSAAFGGAVYAALGLAGETTGGQIFIPVSMRVLVLSFALCYAAVSLVFRRMGRRAERTLVRLEIELGEKSLEFQALEDTGNELSDPVTGDKVVFLEKKAAEELLGAEIPEEAAEAVILLQRLGRRARLLCFSSLAGEMGLAACFRADRVRINGQEAERLVGIARGKLSADGEYQGIV